MTQHEFNKELGEYIDARKGSTKKKTFFGLFKSRPRRRSREDGLMETKNVMDDIEDIEEDIEEVEEMEEELEEEREHLVRRLLRKLHLIRSDDYEEYEEYEEAPPLDEEVIEVLKLSFTWINKLPPAEKKAFKQSEDFQKYKAVLGKYGLIKEG